MPMCGMSGGGGPAFQRALVIATLFDQFHMAGRIQSMLPDVLISLMGCYFMFFYSSTTRCQYRESFIQVRQGVSTGNQVFKSQI